MAYNLPAFNSANFSIGPAIVKLGPIGATPSVDLGAIEAANFEFIAEVEDVFLGAPRRLVAVLPSQEEFNFSWTVMEWDIQNFHRAVGVGTTDATSFKFGEGSVAKEKFSSLYQHRVQGSGSTFEVRVWEAIPAGPLPVSLEQSQTMFELNFRALRATANWRSETVDEYMELVVLS